MASLLSTTRATTRRILVLLVRSSSAVGVTPFTLNSRSLRFEALRRNWARAVLLLNVLVDSAMTAYLAVMAALILRGAIDSGSIANSGIHLQFTAVFVLACGLQIFMVVNTQSLIKALNQFVRFWHQFEEAHDIREAVSDKERLLQATLATMMAAVPSVCLLVLLAEPFATRYPGWLVGRLGLATHSPTLHTLLSALAASSYIALIPTFTGILLLTPTFHLLYIHKMTLWLVQLRDTPPAPRAAKEAMRSFRQLQVLHCIVMRLLSPFFLPFGLLGVYLLGFVLNFLFIVHRPRLPPLFVPPYAIGSFICAGVLVHGGQYAARVPIVSGQLVRRWGRYARETGDKELGAWLRACAPLRVEIGPFFPIKRSTAYKFVLFHVLNTFKVVLTFGKRK